MKKSVEGHIRGGRRRKEWQRDRRKKGEEGEEKRRGAYKGREKEKRVAAWQAQKREGERGRKARKGTPLPLPFFTLPFQPLPCRLCEGDKPCKVNSLSPS